MSVLLQAGDQALLDEEFDCQVQAEGGLVCIVFREFRLVSGLTPTTTDLLVRLPGGFPDAHPDMFWLADPVRRTDGRMIPATDLVETYLGRTWYRWSRHVDSQWRPGIDDLRSYLAYIRKALQEAAA